MGSPTSSSRVGSGNYNPGQINNPNPAPSPTSTSMSTDEIIKRINQKFGDKDWSFTDEEFAPVSLIDRLSDSTLTLIGKILKNRGKTVTASREAIKNMFITEPELATIAARAENDANKLISLLGEDTLPGLTKSGTGTTIPTRQIYQYSDDDIRTIVDESYMNSVGRKATPEEFAARLASVRTDLSVGTLTTTKKIKNPKTGALENVVTQEAGPTKTSIQTGLETEIKAAAPEEVDIKQRGEFASWLSQNAAGA